jgi:hypothetical protein
MRVNDVIMTRIDGKREHCEQRDQLEHALIKAGALAEIDADVLGLCRGREDCGYRERYRRRRRETDAGSERSGPQVFPD